MIKLLKGNLSPWSVGLFLSVILGFLFIQGCSDNDSLHDEPELSKPDLEQSIIMDAFNGLSNALTAQDSKDNLTKNLSKVWKSTQNKLELLNFSPKYLGETPQFTEEEQMAYENYFSAYESLFDNLQAHSEANLLSSELQEAIAVFETKLGIKFDNQEDDVSVTKRRRKRYCCCCKQKDLYSEITYKDQCRSFKARKWWAKIRCRALKLIFQCLRTGTSLRRGSCY